MLGLAGPGWLLACDPAPAAVEPGTLSPRVAQLPTLPAARPTDAAGILAELVPLPGRAVVIVYDVTGPAGISGTLELLASEGGLRRENWALTLPLPGGAREIRGSAVHTPDVLWRAEGEQAGTVEPAQLGAAARTIAALPPARRDRVIDAVRAWRDELELARSEDPGARETIAGVECVRVRAGGGEVCTWEAAGLPLRYDGPSFTVVATHIEQGSALGMHAFEIPSQAAAPPLRHEPAELGPTLEAIEAGDRAAILRLVHLDTLPLASITGA
ncbi:MAG: hypothetical protein K1X88_25140 [Nannocystaceae bacterium]|nr:hypothetical protein [Nannocystaceae bacterium]